MNELRTWSKDRASNAVLGREHVDAMLKERKSSESQDFIQGWWLHTER